MLGGEGDLLGSRPSPLLGPQPPPGRFLSCWKEFPPLFPPRASSSPLWTSDPSPCPALTTQPHPPLHTRGCSKQGSAEAPLLCRPFCPSASLCPAGCSPKTCGCPNHILLGSVVTPSGRPLPGAKVSLRDWPGTVATSDAHGTFRMPGVCASSQTNVSAQMDGFSAGTAQAQANSSISAVVTIVLDKLGKCLVAKGIDKLGRKFWVTPSTWDWGGVIGQGYWGKK